jgi:dUTP pyrophosphatase
MLEVKNKSGIASKKQLVTGACVVDSGYDGELFVNLHNIGERAQVVEPGQKIAQGVFVKIEQPMLIEISEDNIYGGTTARGTGALGSTGDF